MKRFATVVALVGLIPACAYAAVTPRRRATVRAAVTSAAIAKAAQWWGSAPGCALVIRYARLPAGLGMIDAPTCEVDVNTRVYTRKQFHRMHASRPGRYYDALVWKFYCASMISEVGAIMGHTPPADPIALAQFNEHAYRFCGSRVSVMTR